MNAIFSTIAFLFFLIPASHSDDDLSEETDKHFEKIHDNTQSGKKWLRNLISKANSAATAVASLQQFVQNEAERNPFRLFACAIAIIKTNLKNVWQDEQGGVWGHFNGLINEDKQELENVRQNRNQAAEGEEGPNEDDLNAELAKLNKFKKGVAKNKNQQPNENDKYFDRHPTRSRFAELFEHVEPENINEVICRYEIWKVYLQRGVNAIGRRILKGLKIFAKNIDESLDVVIEEFCIVMARMWLFVNFLHLDLFLNVHNVEEANTLEEALPKLTHKNWYLPIWHMEHLNILILSLNPRATPLEYISLRANNRKRVIPQSNGCIRSKIVGKLSTVSL